MKEEDLIALIDEVLKDDDKNNDGYIDYAEFAKSLEWSIVWMLVLLHHLNNKTTEETAGREAHHNTVKCLFSSLEAEVSVLIWDNLLFKNQVSLVCAHMYDDFFRLKFLQLPWYHILKGQFTQNW